MGATTTEGTGKGSAEGPLRGLSLDNAHKILIGEINALKTCIEIKDGKPTLRVNAEDVAFDDTGFPFTADTVQEAIQQSIDPSANTSILVWSPGSPRQGNVYSDFAELMADFADTNGLVQIYPDPFSPNPLIMPAPDPLLSPDGSWDFEYRGSLIGPLLDTGVVSSGIANVAIPNGVFLKQMVELSGGIILTATGTTTSPITTSISFPDPLKQRVLTVKNSASIRAGTAGTVPFIKIDDSPPFLLAFITGIGFGIAPYSIVEVGAGSTLNLVATVLSGTAGTTFSGPGDVNITIDDLSILNFFGPFIDNTAANISTRNVELGWFRDTFTSGDSHYLGGGPPHIYEFQHNLASGTANGIAEGPVTVLITDTTGRSVVIDAIILGSYGNPKSDQNIVRVDLTTIHGFGGTYKIFIRR